MPKKVSPMEYREILRRLKLKQSIRSIHRDSGYSRELIRKVRDVAKAKGWLDASSLPTEKEILKYIEPNQGKTHPLDKIKQKIKHWVESGYTYIVIAKLVNEHCYNYNEITVRRYIQRQFPKMNKPICRRHFNPGETAEVDFGYLGVMYDAFERRNRKVWLFSMRLNYSRYCYRELVFNQQASTFFQCHVHAFEYVGGVPHKIVCDNLKSAVIQASLQEPLVNKSYQMLAEHYGFLISANKPATPQHKGGVEKDIDYVKRNFYPIFIEHQQQQGRTIADVADCKKELAQWTQQTDINHQIKYTNATPEMLFAEEQPLLLPLRFDRWDPITWYHRKVGDDWKVQINKAFYSVPYQYIGKTVTAYINSTEVVIFYNYDQIACHRRAKRDWQRVINPHHAPPNYDEYLNSTSVGVKKWAALIGQPTLELVTIILHQRHVDGLRPARALCALSKTYSDQRLNNACHRALYYRLYSFHNVKNILQQNLDQLPLEQITTDLFPAETSRETHINYQFARTGLYFND